MRARAESRSDGELRELLWSEIVATGLRQADVCAIVGISQKHLSTTLKGHNGMSLAVVDQVLAALNRKLVLTTVPLMGGEDESG